MLSKTELEAVFDAGLRRFLEEWKEFLRFPSVSTDPAHDADCLRCAQWLRAHLEAMGLRAELLATTGKPVVYAEYRAPGPAPTVLLYGHYDVQPADPLDAWHSPPFEPTLRDGRLYARGAQDNKGQVFYGLKAAEALIRHGALGVNVKVLVEGEEESGSTAITDALPGWRERLAADVLMVTDTGTVASGAPTIVMGLRGILFASVRLSGPRRDLHSGVHGGVAPNPAQAMARLVASLHDADGRIAVEGYYDGVEPPTELERRLAGEHAAGAEAYRAATGVPPAGGERGLGAATRAGFRPTIEVNGIHSGYGGAGSKTIIPASATAKLSSRLVPGQDPQRCMDLLCRHIERHAPAGLTLTVDEKGVAGPGFRLDPASALAQRARSVLDRLGDQPTAFLWEGASIPVVFALARAAGAEPLLCGFGSEADNLHAPNESFSLDQFRRGFLYAALMLQAF